MTPTLKSRLLALALLAAAAVSLASCAVNPATGQSQLSLFDEAEEIAMGAAVDQEFLANSGVYSDPRLAAYVSQLGLRLAAVSERPDLPWTFRIADDEGVNAFALPGGRVYVTRGLLAHLSHEAELAGVLGHEIGHVTARHAVNGISRELAISLGVAAGLALLDADDTTELVSGLGLDLLFLKFGRNQERQADQLGVRYAQRAGLDPHGMVDALRVLQQVSHAQAEGWFPVWLSTHPDPDKRWQRLAEETGLGPGLSAGALEPEVDAFVARLDGLAYGPDLRNGAWLGNAYVQFHDGFQMTFPAGWKIERDGQTVAAATSASDALVMLLPQLGATELAAEQAFAQEEGIVTHERWAETLGGLPARLVHFEGDLDGEAVEGIAVFVRTPGRVVALLGLSPAASWRQRRPEVERSLRSIGRLSAQQPPPAPPDRLRIVTLDRAMTLREIAGRYSPNVDPATLALLNQIGLDQPIRAGRRVKVVQGGQ
jgi:predicted Zn-dependent protease